MGVIRYQLCYDVDMCDVKIVIEGAVGKSLKRNQGLLQQYDLSMMKVKRWLLSKK